MNKKSSLPLQFILGLVLAFTAAVLMFFGILPIATRITIGIVGIGLIASSKFRLL